MLPSLRQSQTKQQTQSQSNKGQAKKLALSKITKNVEQASYYEQKYESQLALNNKLKKLLSSLRSNKQTNTIINQEENQVKELVRERRKLDNQVQHQAHALNILISDNNKLKTQVDSQRNKRAIYFNIYKNLEHQIHQWESRYKNILIQTLKSQGAIVKLKQKFRKAIRKVQKDIQNLTGQLDNLIKPNIELEQQTEKQQQKKQQGRGAKPKPIKDQVVQLKQKSEVYLTCLHQNSQTKPQQPQNLRRSIDCQHEYQVQQKSIEVLGIVNRLKQICGKNDVHECCALLRNIQDEIQYNFGLFKDEEKREKQLHQKYVDLQNQLIKVQDQNLQRKSTQIVNLQDKEVFQLVQKMKQMENKLSQKIGVRVQQLSNQILLHHCLRIRDQKKEGKKNLQRYLQHTKKQKPQCSLLLSPQQMHKKVIHGQTTV